MATVEGRVFDENGANACKRVCDAIPQRCRPVREGLCPERRHLRNSQGAWQLRLRNACHSGVYRGRHRRLRQERRAPEQPVDSGAAVMLTPPPAPKKRKAAEAAATAETAPQPAPEKTAKPRDISMAEDVPPVPAEAEKPKATQAPPPVLKPAAQSVKAPSTLDEAMAFVVPTGRYAGKTFRAVA